MLTQEIALNLWSYDPETGIFRWKKNNKMAGGFKEGYWVIGFEGKNYYGHRLAWLIITGYWPSVDIDHADRNRGNNAFSNLREASPSQNGSNCPIRSHNKLGFKGVCRDKNRYRAQITVNGICRKIGRFDTPEAAHAAYVAEAKRVFGEFARAA